MAIPKVIHYCWFGDKPIPESVSKCISSWEKHCPEYEIRKWSEKDIDISINQYTQQAYTAKAWGFVPDYLRLWIIYNYGGIYLDTDVQVIRSFDPLLNHNAFAGMEEPEYVALGLGFGAEAGNEFIKEHMQQYDALSFINKDGSYNKTPSPHYTTALLKEHGFIPGKVEIQNLDNVVIYPPEYFCPKEFSTGITRITRNTFSIHQFDASWYSEEEQKMKHERWHKARKDYIAHIPNRVLRRILGDIEYEKLKRLLRKDRL